MALDDVTAAATELAKLRAAVGDLLQRRDTAVGQAFAEGIPIGAIAGAANLTSARVGSILGHPFERVGLPSRTPAGASGESGERHLALLELCASGPHEPA